MLAVLVRHDVQGEYTKLAINVLYATVQTPLAPRRRSLWKVEVGIKFHSSFTPPVLTFDIGLHYRVVRPEATCVDTTSFRLNPMVDLCGWEQQRVLSKQGNELSGSLPSRLASSKLWTKSQAILT
jgi:hypothetical protein